MKYAFSTGIQALRRDIESFVHLLNGTLFFHFTLFQLSRKALKIYDGITSALTVAEILESNDCHYKFLQVILPL